MKKYFFLFFLFIFISSVSASISSTGNIPDITLNNSLSYTISVKNYFVGSFDSIFLNFSTNSKSNLFVRSFNDASTCYDENIRVCVYPSSNDFTIVFTSLGLVSVSSFQIIIYNNSVWSPFQNISNVSDYGFDTFNVNSVNEVSSSGQGLNGPSSDGFIGSIASGFNSVYPNSSNLSVGARFSYVLVTVLFFAIITYILFFSFTLKAGGKGFIPSIAHYIVLVECVLMFFYFVAISYIPLGVLVVIVLILIALTYFRVRSGFSGGSG